MSDLQQLAKQKTEAASERRIAALPGEIQALQRELAARGLLHSGAMLKRVLAACTSAHEAQATAVIAEYEWAATHALVVTQSWTESLVTEACQSFEALQTASLTHIAKASEVAGRPELAA